MLSSHSKINMLLHIFNPEHDMVMPYGKQKVILPHAIAEFKNNLAFLPVLWAEGGDCVLVDDIAYAAKAAASLRKPHARVTFVTKDEVAGMTFDGVSPWGWDDRLCEMLRTAGVGEDLLPSEERIQRIKDLSSRCQTLVILRHLRRGHETVTCGESMYAESLDTVYDMMENTAA